MVTLGGLTAVINCAEKDKRAAVMMNGDNLSKSAYFSITLLQK